jgi:hypothetical protein
MTTTVINKTSTGFLIQQAAGLCRQRLEIRATRLYIVFVLKDWIGQFAAAGVNFNFLKFFMFSWSSH